MDFVTHSDPVIRFAFWAGLGASVLALLLVLQVVLMRFWLLRREKRKQHFLSVWQPLIVQSLAGVDVVYPKLDKRNVKDFLLLWNHFQESLRGEARDRLNQLACDISVDMTACSLLRHRSVTERLLAMMALGYLRKKSAWQPLLKLLRDKNPRVSLAAAGALMKIEPEAAIALVVPLLVLREDWPQAKVATMLKEAGPAVISNPLAESIRKAAPQHICKLIGYLDLIYSDVSFQVIREILHESQDPQTIAACLRALTNPRDLDLARQYIQHPDWAVRVQAASALGRIGTNEDRDRLVRLLTDPQWWVRYRAAQALSRFPLMTTDELRRIQTQQTDRFARDMLGQVLAERTA